MWSDIIRICATLALALSLTGAAYAAEPEAAEEKATKAAPGHPHGAGITLAGFSINGRFDLAYEFTGFEGFPEDDNDALRNYHHFIFISRNKKDEPFSISAEIIDLTFYELTIKLCKHSNIRLGKILVPFGADPLYHHSYGGLSGFDQKLTPVIWAELGASYQATILQGDFTLENELYVVTGYRAEEDQVVSLSAAGDPERLALGDRIRAGYGKFSAYLSFYWNQYAPGRNLFLWGFDVAAARGFLPWPYLENLSVKLGLIRADVRSEVLGDYYHFGDYLQVDYRLPKGVTLRYRTGMVAFKNHQNLFFDTDRKDAKDTVAHSFSIWWRTHLLSLGAEYILNLEAKDEIENDLIRFTAVVEF
jgi:hypothetical protein